VEGRKKTKRDMNSDRIKEIQMATAYPDSISVQQALLQVWNECEQEKLQAGIGCKCKVITGTTEIMCCNNCGLPTEEFWVRRENKS
jgi:hypothetical protein